MVAMNFRRKINNKYTYRVLSNCPPTLGTGKFIDGWIHFGVCRSYACDTKMNPSMRWRRAPQKKKKTRRHS